MRRIFLVAQREYVQNVRTKGFWIGIFFFPVLLTAFIVVPQLLERTKSARRYAVVDQSGWLLEAVNQRIAVGDLQLALDAAADRASSPDDAEKLPGPLRAAASDLSALTSADRMALATALLRSGDGADLSPQARTMYDAHGDALRSWWSGVSRDTLRALDVSFSFTRYVQMTAPSGPDAAAAEALNRRVADDDLFAYFVLDGDPVSGVGLSRYVSKNLTDEDLREWFGSLATNEVRERRLEREAIDPGVARWIQTPVRFDVRKVSAEGAEESIGERDMLRQWAPVVFVYLLWISVWSVSQMLMMNTVEEKSSRVIEVLLSSVSPVQLLAGKIVGIAATGLTMVLSWLLAFFLATKYLPGVLGASPDLPLSTIASDPLLLGSFLAYFLLGYLFYAAILVGLGSVCNTVSDAQNMMPAFMLVLIVPLLAMVPIGRDPNGVLAQVLSYIPPFTPFVMMNRAAGPPTMFEYAVTTALLVVSIMIALWAGAKVFRIGVLLTGKPPKLKEILRWIRAPVGMVPVRKEVSR
jgi:ABC-2 type transport system permease protein